MADLIDRAALLVDIEEAVIISGRLGETNAEMRGANKVTHRIKVAKAVDAVEVVRCKDCKRNEKNGGDCNRTLTITERDYVLELNVSKYITLDFCSYGERRADATD